MNPLSRNPRKADKERMASKSLQVSEWLYLFTLSHGLKMELGAGIKMTRVWCCFPQHGGLLLATSTLEVHPWSVPYGLVLDVAKAAATLSVAN